MKLFKYIGLCVLLVLTTTSCTNYLNINTDPDTPSNSTASVQTRLPWMQHYYLYAQGVANVRTALITQENTSLGTRRATRDGYLAGWRGDNSTSTTVYQWLFIGCLANFNDMIAKCEEVGAYQYEGATYAIKAMAFMLMQELYGEMPYTEALGSAVTPKYDNGKVIFNGCISDIDKAIELLNKPQASTVPALSAGDSWNGGDVNKWIAMCYGLKARWLNNLSKKSGTYDTATILDCLSKAPTSNAVSTVIKHQDLATDNVGDILFSDPMYANVNYCSIGMNKNTRPTSWYTGMLTNFDNKGIEDPRADKLLPWRQGGDKIWRRSSGADQQSPRRMSNYPYPTTYNDHTGKAVTLTASDGTVLTVAPGSWYCNTTDKTCWGDTIYNSFYSSALNQGDPSEDWTSTDGSILASGTMFTRPTSPTFLVTYPEMCFIKAEIYFNKGDKGTAYAAYKDGIQASIDLMNSSLAAYNKTDAQNPSKSQISSAKVDAFMNGAIGTQDDLTLGKIMEQKFIAMSMTSQNWTDMRRYDYNTTAYPNWAIPYEYYQDNLAQKTINMGFQYRRWSQPGTLETSYNEVEWKASNKYAAADNIWQYPCWFDCATDAQYNEQMNTPVQ